MTEIRLSRRALLAIAGAGMAGALALTLVFPTLLTIGRMFEADGQLELAIDYYSAWNERYPDDLETRWHVAELLLETADPARAVVALDAMAKRWPSDARILARLVEIEDSLLRVDGVIPRLEALARARPDDPQILQRLADHYRWLGRSEALIGVLQRLVLLGGYADERVELVDILLSHRRYDELIEFFSAGIEIMPNPVEARLALHQAYLRTGQKEQALEQLRELLEIEPAQVGYLRELADGLVQHGRVDEAIELYRRRIDADPHDRELRAELGQLYELAAEQLVARGERAPAIALYRKRIALDPTNVELRLALADMHGRKTHGVAIEELRELLERAPRSQRGWAALAERLSWSGDLAAAVDAFQRAHELAPGDLAVRRALARHLVWSNDSDAALPHYRALVELGAHKADRAALVELLINVDRGEEAYREARKLLGRGTSTLRDRRLFALAAGLAGDCEAAMPRLREITEHDPNDAAVWYRRARCATQLANPDEALAALRETQRIRAEARRRRGGER